MSYESFLHLVSKPSRYISVEKNAIRKDWSKVHASFLLCFPEVYELGMSHLGLKILYHMLNKVEWIAAERSFAPWMDMEAELRKNKQCLLSLESQKPVREFDFVGFSLQSELTFTNLINILDLSGIPIWSRERKEGDPIVLAGGPVTSNPEPCADFIDAFLIGDGEEALLELAEYYKAAKEKKLSRERMLVGIASIPGFYVPALYREEFDSEGNYAGVVPLSDEVPKRVLRRFVPELKIENYPVTPVIPQTAAVQDRHIVEVVRGCTQGCRFCQAGYIYRPIRELSIPDILKLTNEGLEQTGYDEVGLVSLSTADYSDVAQMVDEVSKVTSPKSAAISLPSLRADRFSVEIADSVKQIKQTGFTFAPEAGSRRLRRVINKNITNEELLASIDMAFAKGWSVIKLYFMVGLPSETMEDIDETIDLIRQVEALAKKNGGKKTVNVSFGPFVPKAHTPFQWDRFLPCDEINRRIKYLRERVSSRIVHFKWQAPELSHFEAVISKGNRSIAKGLYQAWLDGSRFEGWQELFDYTKVMNALRKAGVDIENWSGEKSLEAPLPWDHIDSLIKKKFLTFERKKAFREENSTTTDCRFGDCHYCGVPNPKEDIKLKNNKPSKEELDQRRASRNKSGRDSEAFNHNRSDSQRYRLVYTKMGLARFLAHSDLIRLFTMGFAVSKIPVTLSKGFTPRPVVQFGAVLPLGLESKAEFLDLWVYEALTSQHIQSLNEFLTDGVEILHFAAVDNQAPSTSAYFSLARYKINGLKWDAELQSRFDGFQKSPDFMVEHREKNLDLKKAAYALNRENDSLNMDVFVGRQDGNNANPHLILQKVLGISKEDLGVLSILKTENLPDPLHDSTPAS